MQGKQWGNDYRTTLVCIDCYDRGVPEGRLYNPFLPRGESFWSLIEFIRKMEELLDSLKFPQPFAAVRAFQAPAEERRGTEALGEELRTGKLATFQVRIIFRQSASWQGSVLWLEGRQEESFRSALELFLLMDSALRSRREDK